MDDIINVVIRILPGGDEADIELPVSSTAQEIIEAMIADDLVPSSDERGNPYNYELTAKDINKEIASHMSLEQAGVRNGFTLMLQPKLVAG